MNPLTSVKGTIISAIILGVVIAYLLKGHGNAVHMEVTIWIHTIMGVLWIGLLYYFNFIQVPALATAMADKDGPGPAAIGKYIAPRALLWFRWSALLTWGTGAAALYKFGILQDAFMLQGSAVVIGVGAWLGTIMLFNVWVLIWPNQKKVLGIVEATAEEITSAKFIALMASRVNTVLSVPMLLCMTASTYHNGGLPF